MKFINVPVFIISLSIGLFLSYITMPKKTVIFVYPTPENYKKLQYKDKAGNCFAFEPEEVSCPIQVKYVIMKSKNNHAKIIL